MASIIIHNGLARDMTGVELDEIHRSSHNNSPISEFKQTSSHTSIFTGYSLVKDDDEQSLIPRQISKGSRHDPDEASKGDSNSSHPSRKRRSRFTSWKVGVTMSASMTTIVLFVNIVLTVWASVKYGLDNGIGTAYEGSCGVVSAWSFWLHILINGLSSMMLSASNYTMQCVAAPTRIECDRAHACGDWLDIGVPSVRNLYKIGWQRRIMWALLAISSTPIHLLYNSAVFKTLDDNRYERVLAGSEFTKSDYIVPPMALDYLYDITLTMHEAYTSNPGSFENISSKACIETYATYYLSGHGNLLLITDDNAAEVVPIVPTWYEYDLPSDNMNTPFKWQVQSQSSALSPNALIPEQDVPERRLQDPGGDEEAEHKSVDSEWYNSQLLLVADTGRALQITVLRSNTSRRHYLQRHQMRCHVLRGLAPTRYHIHHFWRRNR